MSSSTPMPRGNLKLSLLARLLICFGLGGVLIGFVAFYAMTDSPKPFVPGAGESKDIGPLEPILPLEMRRRVVFSRDLMKEYENPLTRGQALREARQEKIDFRYESPTGSFATDPRLPSVESVLGRAIPFPAMPDYLTGSAEIAHVQGLSRWIVRFPKGWKTGLLHDPRFGMMLAGQLAVVLGLCAVFAFWQLAPLRDLRQAAEEVGRGNFDFQLPVRQRSELGDLARAFNQMTSQIRELVRARQELLIAVSHELRSPLTRIRLSLSVEGEEGRSRVDRCVTQMERLVTELLETNRLDSPHASLEWRPVALRALFVDVRLQLDCDPRLKVELPEEHQALMGDPLQLARAIRNLVENAFKHSGSPERPVELSSIRRNDGFEIRVRDHGFGVPPELVERIFEPFFRVDSARARETGGHGFGLSLCRKIAALHGGWVRAENHPDGGLLVRLFVPLKRAPTP